MMAAPRRTSPSRWCRWASRTAQALFEAPDTAPPPPGAVHFDVEQDLLGAQCAPDRATREPVHPAVPALQRGSVADYSIHNCALLRYQQFAEVLNNLALANGSTVTYQGTTYETVESVIRALLAAEHHIKIENNRYFADFLGLYMDGMAVIAPAWLDTGIPLPSGNGNILLPAPHTHRTFHISGPLVNASITYYMGVSGGVGFRADGNIRSPWNGESTRWSYDSANDLEPDQLDVADAVRRIGETLPFTDRAAMPFPSLAAALAEWD
jgi:hypothetical protein